MEQAERRERLRALLEPVHERARLSARRMCRSDAEGDDLFQDAVVRALVHLAELRDDGAFAAWFYRILLSLHRSRARRGAWRRWLSMDEVQESDAEPVGDDGTRWEDERLGAERMRRALATLPSVQREAVVLADVDEYPLEEIARMQGVSLSAVKSRVARGRERLARHYRRQRERAARPERAWTGEHAVVRRSNQS
jgi:RNA polymerase sigma-70 factor, ECF subfamily